MLLLYFLSLAFTFPLLVQGSVLFNLGASLTLFLVSDTSSSVFISTLIIISSSVLVWSYYYIDTEPHFRRFFFLVCSFLISIFFLVFSADLLSLFVAWDLLGFTSLFLVLFFRSRASIAGGLLTGLTNRLGDVFFLGLLGLALSGSAGSTFLIFILLLIVSFTNSAQAPFSSWLPAAMLAPTPVSALVHSSTLVTAGVYLLYRFLPLSHSFLLWVGIFTVLIAGTAACAEVDINNIIALSTLSQLGLIMSSLGLGERSLCFAHLNAHATVKALLFMIVGSVIHGSFGNQEVRSSPLLIGVSPGLCIILGVASSSLCGLVFLSGAATKDAVLLAFLNMSVGGVALFLFYLGIFLTVAYSSRIFFLFVIDMASAPSILNFGGLSIIKKGSMGLLLLLATCQGLVCEMGGGLSASVIGVFDNLMIWVSLLIGLVLGYVMLWDPVSFSTPFSALVFSVSGASVLASATTTLQFTEVSSLQGLGLGRLQSLGSVINSCSPTFIKWGVLLSLCFLLM